jgi:uncharacterized protein YfaS (alpha-2-macroglobulin family)
MTLTRSLLMLSLGLLVLAGHAAGAPATENREVELIFEGEQLQPTSTLELRFARELVGREQLGVAVTPGPLAIEPALPGSFTWLSRRSGVYVPSEPPAMGVEYTVSLRAGLKDSAGAPIGSAFKAVLKTPAFGVSVPPQSENDDLPPLPEVKLAFNRDVKVEGGETLFRFVNAGGEAIAATVRHATRNDYFQIPAEAEALEKRWALAHTAVEKAAGTVDEEAGFDEQRSKEPRPNRVIVKPVQPLSPGSMWRLQLKPGLAAATGGYTVKQEQSWELGVVRPFELRSLVTSSYLNSGKSALLDFTEQLAPDITNDNAAQYLKVTPAVPNLRYQLDYRQATIRGDFTPGTEYTLQIADAVVAESGLPFSGQRVRTFVFGPVRPRVYLPEITGHQVMGGRRKFPIVSVNVQSLHVVARLVTEKVPQSVEAFEKYEKEYEEAASEERYQRLPAKAIAGKVIYEKSFTLAEGPMDAGQETVLDWSEIMGGVKAGAIFLTVEGKPMPNPGGRNCGAQALMQLTDLGMIWKKLDDRVQVSVFSMATGQPAAGVKLALLGEDFKEAHAAQSDATGTASLKPPAVPGWVVARLGTDVHAVRVGPLARELPMAAFRLPIDYVSWERQEARPGPRLRAMIFTDRPLYRPGETVRVKGLVRKVDAQGLSAAAGLEATMVLHLPHQKGEQEITVKTDARGSFDHELVLDAYTTGGHGLRLTVEGQFEGGYANFHVAEFQPNAFELTVAGASRYAPGEAVSAEVSGKYFFGGSLAGSPLKWTLQYGGQAFVPEGFEDFAFGETLEQARKPLTLRGQGALSKDGVFSLKPPLPDPQGTPARGLLTVEVTNANQQTVTETKVFDRDAAAFYVGLRVPNETLIGPQEEIVARAIAVKPDGQPVPEPVSVKVELVRMKFNTVRALGAGNTVTFHTETAEEVVATAEGKTVLPQRRGTAWEVKEGETARFKPGKTGEYKLRVKAADAQGRAVSSSFSFNVTGDDPAGWDFRHPAQVELLSDRMDYRAGEKARVMVKTPFSGEALISIEREAKVLRTLRLRLEGNAPTFEVPIEAGDAPNVFVSLVLIRGTETSTRKFKVPEYRYGACQLQVVDPTAALAVQVLARTPAVQPAAEVTAEVLVQDGAGAPVPDAEVTFFAADDGILSLTGYERPQPLPLFYTPLPLKVRTGVTLYELLPEDPNELEFGNKGYLIGGGGLEGPGPKVRRNFPGTAAWFPSLKTDRAGKVVVRFTAPDALTRYRLVAVANAGAKRFGSGESSFTITKKLILLSALGQAAHAGDEILARAVVRNESGRDGTAEVALQLDALAESAAGPLQAKLDLKAGELRTVDFPVRLRKSGEAAWTWSARMAAGGETHEDQLAAPLRIRPAAPILRETYLSELAGQSNDLLAGVNPQLVEGAGSVRVTLANSRLAGLQESAHQLLRYPYGCAEQLLSALVPWIVVQELGPVLPDLGRSPEEIALLVRTGAEKVFSMQTPSGGISYWPGGRPSLFASAYAAVVLALVDPEGELPLGGWDKLLDYLGAELRGLGKRTGVNLDDYALALYALSLGGEPEPAYTELLYSRRTELSLEGRALLACAVAELQGQASMVASLLDPRAAAPESLSWFGSPTRERAIRLIAWSQFKPADKEVGRLVQEILRARTSGHWRTTQENAWALLGLSRYFARVEKEIKPVAGRLVKDRRAFPFALNKTRKSTALDFPFDAAKPLGQLAVENPQKGALYGETHFAVEPAVAEQPRQDRGYSVSRTYRKLSADGKLEEAKDLAVGDRVLVSLRIATTVPGHFVAIDDPLPAILEAVNPEFRTQAVGGAPGLEQSWAADYREIRADRVLYFCDHLPAGTFAFQYLARVRTAGKVIAPAVKVEEMYRPERFGLSATDRLESKAGK